MVWNIYKNDLNQNFFFLSFDSFVLFSKSFHYSKFTSFIIFKSYYEMQNMLSHFYLVEITYLYFIPLQKSSYNKVSPPLQASITIKRLQILVAM